MSYSYRLLFLLGLPALLLPFAAGCSRELPYGVVEGVVTLDGKPLTNAEVVFLPDPDKGTPGRRSVALTDAQGHYRIASDEGRAGAPVGFHRVCVNDLLLGPPGTFPGATMAVVPSEGGDAKGRPAGTVAPPVGTPPAKKSRFPTTYSSANSTPFRDVEVKPGDQVLNFDLKSK